MSVLSIKDIVKSFGADEVLSGAGFHLEPGERVGLVGVNGCGKTTLLDIISGGMRPDSGTVSLSRVTSIGYLKQTAVHSEGSSILEVMLQARPEVLNLKERLAASAEAVSRLAKSGGNGYDSAMEEYGSLLEQFESSGGYAYENEVTGTLIGLGFGRDNFGRATDNLSGGEKTRLALARLLLAGHDVLLLDEPTNHLDISAIGWLEGFLERFTGSALIVSHDRYFLDRVATRILELDGGTLESYRGNYTRYRAEKRKRDDARRKEYELAHARYEKEKEYINRMRAGVNSDQAKGREKRLSRLEMPDKPSVDKRPIKLGLTSNGRTADEVVRIEGVNKSFGNSRVLSGVSFTIRRGERVGIVGPNGSGKSTLVKIIMGLSQADSGTAQLGVKVMPGYYAQGLEGLDEDSTVIDELWSKSPMSTERQIRNLLGAFLFTGDDASKRVGSLSGGEKGRLAIAGIVLKGANLLVLDEPTNHLDIPSREALEQAVSGFDGTVLAVSHDRFFLGMFAERMLEVEDGRLTEYWGNYTDYARKKTEPPREEEISVSEGKRAWEDMKELRATQRRKQRDEKRQELKISGIESDIKQTELTLMKLETELADPGVFGDYAKVAELTGKYEELKAARDKLYEQLDKELA